MQRTPAAGLAWLMTLAGGAACSGPLDGPPIHELDRLQVGGDEGLGLDVPTPSEAPEPTTLDGGTYVAGNVVDFADPAEFVLGHPQSSCVPGWLEAVPGTGLHPRSPESGPLQLIADASRLIIAAEDHHRLLVVDTERLTVEQEIEVAGAPYHLIVDEPGDRVFVSLRDVGRVDELQLSTWALVRSHPVGDEPMGLAFVDPSTVAVAVAGSHVVVLVERTDGTMTSVAIGHDEPQAVAAVDGTLQVGLLGKVGGFATVHLPDLSVDLSAHSSWEAVALTQVTSLTVVDGNRVLAAHSRARLEAPWVAGIGRDPDEEQITPCLPLPVFTGEVCRDPAGAGVVDPVLSVRAPHAPPGFVGGTMQLLPAAHAQSPSATLVLRQQSPLVMGDEVMVVTSHLGRAGLLVSCFDLTERDRPEAAAIVPLPQAANGLTADEEGRIYAWSRFSRQVSRVALGARLGPAMTSQLTFTVANSLPLLADALSPEASRGRVLFHRSDTAGMSYRARHSCASCHPAGRTDGLTWRFARGPRNTPSLAGGVLDTAPFHWGGEMEDFGALVHATVRDMGGTGLSEEQVTAMATWLEDPAPFPAGGRRPLSLQERTGARVFRSDVAGCLVCHPGQDGTDNLNHEGFQSWEDMGPGIQTPPLHGLARTAPYLHTGEVESLEDLVEEWVRTDRMGQGSHLSQAELDALVAYLKAR